MKTNNRYPNKPASILNSIKFGFTLKDAALFKRNTHIYFFAFKFGCCELAFCPIVCHKRSVWSNDKLTHAE